MQSFLGKGLKSPLRMDADVLGGFESVEDVDNVKQCLRDGIFTSFGERPLREALGTTANDIVFENEDVIQSVLKPSIQEYVNRYEPRVILTNVSVTAQKDGQLSVFSVVISYTIRTTNTKDNLVVPLFTD
jgi:uncharacterized protein